MMAINSNQYRNMDATALAAAIRDGQLSAQEVLEQAWQEVDFWQPKLNALVWQDRERTSKQLQQCDPAAPFAGVPLLLKDTGPNHLAEIGRASCRERV